MYQKRVARTNAVSPSGSVNINNLEDFVRNVFIKNLKGGKKENSDLPFLNDQIASY
jgi:hypothetical protein